MNATMKRYVISAVTTFVASFLVSVGVQLQGYSGVDMTQATLVSFGLVALRAGFKAFVEWYWKTSGDLNIR